MVCEGECAARWDHLWSIRPYIDEQHHTCGSRGGSVPLFTVPLFTFKKIILLFYKEYQHFLLNFCSAFGKISNGSNDEVEETIMDTTLKKTVLGICQGDGSLDTHICVKRTVPLTHNNKGGAKK